MRTSETNEDDVCRNDQDKFAEADQRFVEIVPLRHILIRDEHFSLQNDLS